MQRPRAHGHWPHVNVCRVSCGGVVNMLLVLSITFYFHYNIWVCLCSTGPFQYRWLKRYVYSSCYYHHQIGSIHLSYCYHIFLWLCVWDVCYIIFCYLLHLHSGKTGNLFSSWRYVSTYAERQRGGRRRAERILGLQCFHVVCFHYGGSEAVRRRVSAAGPQEWVLEPFFRSALRSGSGLNTNGLKSLEASKPRYWYKKYSNRSEIGQANLLLCCWSTCQNSISRLRDFTESYDKTS